MKKIKNMTAAEAKEAFTKWEVKHPRHDDFDFNSAQIGNYKELFRLADRESIIDLIYDLFNYGFMAGYKQAESEQKAKIDKRVKNDMHRKLLEMVYFLPLGIHANFFYTFMVRYIGKEELEYLFPKKIAKPALEIIAADEAEEAKEKAEREERQKVIDEALKQYEQQKGGASA
ncbi:MAG: hypothetical protein K2P34_01595 [Lachnospiraceae bacterium]|nr:hypothetical protein [Lachnospiraceae bacterium]